MLSSLRSTIFCKNYPSTNTLRNGSLKYFGGNSWKKGTKNVGMNLSPRVEPPVSHDKSALHTILKCSTFTAAFCGSLFVGAAIWNYETIKHLQNKNLPEWLKENWNTLGGYEHKEGEFRKALNKWWNELPEGKRMFWAICAANVMVFLCWRYTPFQNIMMKYFCSNPAAKVVCWPMLMSTFSHYAPFHIFVNMYVLHSFSAVACHSLGREQFLAFYLAGGVLSSLGGNVFKLLARSPGTSLGASGAIMAILGYFCTKYPEAKLGIIFLPNFSFSAGVALKGVMLFDLSGLIFRFKVFDHAAHLSGAIFGILYAMYGQTLIWGNRSSVTKYWNYFSHTYLNKKEK